MRAAAADVISALDRPAATKVKLGRKSGASPFSTLTEPGRKYAGTPVLQRLLKFIVGVKVAEM